MQYRVHDDDFLVCVACDGSDDAEHHWHPEEALRHAFHLAMGAQFARDQRRNLTPWRYGLPGETEIDPDLATAIATEMFGLACTLQVRGGVRPMLLHAANGDGTSSIAVSGSNGECCRIAE